MEHLAVVRGLLQICAADRGTNHKWIQPIGTHVDTHKVV